MTKKFNLLIIGDELLNGRRTDCHLANAIATLNQRGLVLKALLAVQQLFFSLVDFFKQFRNLFF